MKCRFIAIIVTLIGLLLVHNGCSINKEKDFLEKSNNNSFTVLDEIPKLSLQKTEFDLNESITVFYENTDEKDWIGIYPEGADPGLIEAIDWKYLVGEGSISFDSSLLREAGVYWIYLCDNDGYFVLDRHKITVLDRDTSDYGAKEASVSVNIKNGLSNLEVRITPSTEKELIYQLYWSKGKERVEGYEPLCTVVHSGIDSFVINLNEGVFMPENSDGIQVTVTKGRSKPVFASVPEEMKLTESKLLYKFNVITDLHITPSQPRHTSHLLQAFMDIIRSGESEAIFTCGDNTDRGTLEEYALLLDTVNTAGEELPNIYYALGNLDIAYNNNAGYIAQIELFERKLGMDAPYYSVDLNGNRFIVLGSDTLSDTGTVGSEQLKWLEAELEKEEKGEPVFIFLHQPLIETVSGTLYSLNNEIQDWYGVYETSNEIRAILKDYPNAFLFTGHTHWSLESYQPVLLGKGIDANFVNCASVGYLWNDFNTSTGGSEGFYVEVYEDYVLLRGREFVKGNWCAAAQFKIPLIK